MSERERFEEWLLGRDYHRSQLDAKNGVYRDPVVQVQWNVWQARARIAAEREQQLVDALKKISSGKGFESLEDKAAAMRVCAFNALATHEHNEGEGGE